MREALQQCGALLLHLYLLFISSGNTIQCMTDDATIVSGLFKT